MAPEVKAFFDNATNTVSFVIKDPDSASVAIVDSVLDFNFTNGHTDTTSADEVIAYIRANDLKVEWILESHVHADHLSAAPYIQQQVGGKIGIGANITVVQDVLAKCLTRAVNSSVMGRSLTNCSWTGTQLKSAA